MIDFPTGLTKKVLSLMIYLESLITASAFIFSPIGILDQKIGMLVLELLLLLLLLLGVLSMRIAELEADK